MGNIRISIISQIVIEAYCAQAWNGVVGRYTAFHHPSTHLISSIHRFLYSFNSSDCVRREKREWRNHRRHHHHQLKVIAASSDFTLFAVNYCKAMNQPKLNICICLTTSESRNTNTTKRCMHKYKMQSSSLILIVWSINILDVKLLWNLSLFKSHLFLLNLWKGTVDLTVGRFTSKK